MDEYVARQRLLLYSLVRFGGLTIFLLGVAVMYTNVARPGGWPRAGAFIAILGVIDALFAPRLLKRAWNRQDATAESGVLDRPSDTPEQ